MLDLPALIEPLLTLPLADPIPEPDEVKAGWVAFGLWLTMALAVGLLGYSLSRQLRKTQRAKDAGVYGDEPVPQETPDRPEQNDEREQHGADGPPRTGG